MSDSPIDLADLNRRMDGALTSLKSDLAGVELRRFAQYRMATYPMCTIPLPACLKNWRSPPTSLNHGPLRSHEAFCACRSWAGFSVTNPVWLF